MSSLGHIEHERSVSAALFDALWEAPVGIALLDRELRYLRVNPTLARIHGRPIEQHIGRPFEQMFPEASPSLAETLRRVIQSGEAVQGLLLSSQLGISGPLRHWLGSYYPIRTSKGETIGVGCVLVEITDRMRIEEQAEENRARVERAAEQLIVGVVGHDLRTPLSVILTSVNVLQRTEELTERQTKLVMSIQRAANRMEVLARDLLDYTRARWALGIPVTPRPTHLDTICREVIEEATASAPGRAILYSREGEGHGDWDPHRLTQLLGNLLDNALIHGEPEAPVALRWQGEPDQVVLHVENRGVPVPADHIPKLFEPFGRLPTRLGQPTQREGTGLGLFIAREIARAHGGRIAMTSDASKTVVSTWLPRRARTSG